MTRVGAWRSSRTKTPRSDVAADQPAERLAQAQPDDAVIIRFRIAVGQMHPPLPVQDVGARPGRALEHHQAQGVAGHVDAVAHGVGAEQAAFLLGAEDVDQRGIAHRVDVLGIERAVPPASRSGAMRVMHRAEPGDRGEQAQRPAAGGQEQGLIGAGQLIEIAGGQIGDDEGPGLRRVIERRGDRGADRR